MSATTKRIESVPVWLVSFDDEDLSVLLTEHGAKRYAEIMSRQFERPVHITPTLATIPPGSPPSITFEHGKQVTA